MVFVEWLDSTSPEGWRTTREVSDLADGRHELECWSVGLLIGESLDRIVISTSQNLQGDAISPLAIPKVAITRMRKRTVASVFGPARKETR
jgi:hypothetical protein